MPTALFSIDNHPHYSTYVRVLCDSGSQSNIISDRIVKKLGLPKLPTRTRIIGINGAPASVTGEVLIELFHHDESRVVAVERFVIVAELDMMHPAQTFEPESLIIYSK